MLTHLSSFPLKSPFPLILPLACFAFFNLSSFILECFLECVVYSNFSVGIWKKEVLHVCFALPFRNHCFSQSVENLGILLWPSNASLWAKPYLKLHLGWRQKMRFGVRWQFLICETRMKAELCVSRKRVCTFLCSGEFRAFLSPVRLSRYLRGEEDGCPDFMFHVFPMNSFLTDTLVSSWAFFFTPLCWS